MQTWQMHLQIGVKNLKMLEHITHTRTETFAQNHFICPGSFSVTVVRKTMQNSRDLTTRMINNHAADYLQAAK